MTTRGAKAGASNWIAGAFILRKTAQMPMLPITCHASGRLLRYLQDGAPKQIAGTLAAQIKQFVKITPEGIMDYPAFGGLLTQLQIILGLIALVVINAIELCPIASQNVKT